METKEIFHPALGMLGRNSVRNSAFGLASPPHAPLTPGAAHAHQPVDAINYGALLYGQMLQGLVVPQAGGGGVVQPAAPPQGEQGFQPVQGGRSTSSSGIVAEAGGAEAEAGEGAGSKKKEAKEKKSSGAASRHVAAEQRRRTRINERLDKLRAIVPHRQRANTAAFLEEVIAYVECLQGELGKG
eukprot:CAMPEP_0182874832 /NCGR_PEP_ID=MMETSP0034_2-20130328/13184_1 /TAXON_ID=156128 /ORGANISM="Nephroselmis pyriformis, Strain CCMP717" /LENGTH=184 /DNA_ID=CAMNT_0025007559 /DNA_START=13 /DNA_END=564 /DNA_ORIENTATION=+